MGNSQDIDDIKNMEEQLEIEDKINVATQTLERNIGFVTNCDNKASIVLTIVGVLLTIILTNDGLKEIFRIVNHCIEANTIGSKIYLLCFVIATGILILGISKLGNVLVAKVSEKECEIENRNSKIFFGDIQKNETCESYKKDFRIMKNTDLLDDLIEQIYINARIANLKYTKFNKGFKITLIGFMLFVVVLIIGIYLY